ncbi:MAG: hypothetical protein QF926_14860 [Alphaproteobacteria bacterium]|jgi:hypothetical protein|nr:hypothetical protein [Alphaproteobacteria bacterium]|tara:strand:- start:107 stop:694 length:588 start_codon:yes stop_codon:yes gene_type:complete
MHNKRLLSLAALAAFAAVSWLGTGAGQAAPFAKGPKTSQECDKSEFEVRDGSEHAKSVKTVDKSDKAKGDGEEVKRREEAPDHTAQRIAQAAGPPWPSGLLDVASNCMTRDGLAHLGVDGANLAILLVAEHPLNPDFEFIAYSPGQARHRVYPSDAGTNQAISPVGPARLFVVGQAAKDLSGVVGGLLPDPSKYK